jgi:hypothetical protein
MLTVIIANVGNDHMGLVPVYDSQVRSLDGPVVDEAQAAVRVRTARTAGDCHEGTGKGALGAEAGTAGLLGHRHG